MPETIAAKLVRRFRRNPEPDEVAVVLASEPGMVVGVPVAKTNVRSPRDLQHARLGSKHELKLLDNRDRIAAYAEYCRLDANIPEAGAALDIIASSAIGGEPGNQILGFDLEYAAEFPDADREFIGRLVDRLDLKELAKPIVRARTKFGDVFFHAIVDNLGQILQLKHLEPSLTFAVIDAYGELIGWEYRGYAEKQRMLKKWEVIHLVHMPELGSMYGRSIFASGLRATGFALQGIRDSAMTQVVRNASGQVAMVFGVPSTMDPNERATRYEEMYELTARTPVMIDGKLDRRVIENMNEQPLVLFYDIYPDGKGAAPDVKQLAATNLSGVVEMLENFQDQFVIPLKVPKAQLGIERSGEGIGGNRLGVQTVEFAKYLNSEQHQIVRFVLYVITLAYWLVGRPLKAGMVEVVMPDLTFLDSSMRVELRKIATETAKVATEIGMPFSYIWTEIIWDGDTEIALNMADKYGIDLEAGPAPAEETDETSPEEVNEARRRIARHLAKDLDMIREAVKLVSGVRGSNEQG